MKKMVVKAKFSCNNVEDDHDGVMVSLGAVYGEEGENKDYSTATPCGDLKMKVDNSTPARNFFEIGKDYYLTFEEA